MDGTRKCCVSFNRFIVKNDLRLFEVCSLSLCQPLNDLLCYIQNVRLKAKFAHRSYKHTENCIAAYRQMRCLVCSTRSCKSRLNARLSTIKRTTSVPA